MHQSSSSFNTTVPFFFIFFLKTIIITVYYYLKSHSAPCWSTAKRQNGRKEVAVAQHAGISGHLCVHRDFKPARAWDFPSSTFWTQ